MNLLPNLTTAQAAEWFKRAGVPNPIAAACGEKGDKPAKYGSRKKCLDGFTFDSTAEAKRYVILKAREMAGEIFGLQMQPRFLLQEAFRDKDGKHQRAITYVADFCYGVKGSDAVHVEDVKGMRLPVYLIKLKMFRKRYPDVVFEEVK